MQSTLAGIIIGPGAVGLEQMTSAAVDFCAAALVREWLSRKGHKQVLAVLDRERPRTEHDLTSRAEMVRRMQLEPQVKQNRERLSPLGTLLELVVGGLLAGDNVARQPADSPPSSPDSPGTGRAVLQLPPDRLTAARSAGEHAAPPASGCAGPPTTQQALQSSTAPSVAAEGKLDLGFRPTCSDNATASLRAALGRPVGTSAEERAGGEEPAGQLAVPRAAGEPAHFEGRRGELLLLPPGSVQGQSCVAVDCVGCSLLLLDWSSSVTLQNCHECRVLIGPVDGSIMLRDCSALHVAAVCRQLRCRDCRGCTVSLYTLGVALESCAAMQFGRWDAAYPGMSAHFAAAGFDPAGRNRWQQVYDFTPPEPKPKARAADGRDDALHSADDDDDEAEAEDAPNWTLLPDGACAAMWDEATLQRALRAYGVGAEEGGGGTPLVSESPVPRPEPPPPRATARSPR